MPRCRKATILAGFVAVAALALSLGAGTASAKVQWEAKYTFGPDGTPSTQFTNATAVGVQQAEKRVFVQDTTYPTGKVYGYHRAGPGELTPLGSPFPVPSYWVGFGALPVDNTNNPSKGNFYLALGDYEEVPSIEGWTAAGSPISEFKPPKGMKCGGAVDGEGHLWVANENNGSLEIYDPTGGEPIETKPFANPEESFGRICGIAFNPANGDLFASWRYGAGVWRYTAASNYETATKVPGTGTGSCCENAPPIAIDGNSNRLYVYREGEFHCCPVYYNTKVQVFNLTTLQEVESFTPPAKPVRAFAIDEATDTLFFPFRPEVAGEGEFTKVQEWRKVNAPIATTGPAIANEKVSGSVALDGAGNVTECWAEFGTQNKPEGFTKSSTSCSGSLPYGSDQPNVTVDLSGQVEGEKTYYYRIAATNGEGIGRGEVKSFLPHWIAGLKTLPAANETRTEARLNAGYEGTNEETEYWFEYLKGTGSCPSGCTKTAVQTEAATVGSTNVHLDVSGLEAGNTYGYRVVAKNSKGESAGEMVQFQTNPAVTGVTTKPASEIKKTTAELNGSMNPEGIPTTYYYEWGKDTGYGQTAPAPPGPTTSAGGNLDLPPVELTELEEGTTYHYRLVATNSFGTTYGADASFSTHAPPSITSFNATNLTASSAELVATINPNGFATEYWFEWGPTEDLGNTDPVPNGELPPESTVQEVAVPISGLEQITYYFRLTAKSEWGTTVTELQTFNFNVPKGCPNQSVRQETGSGYVPDCRAYELVSARNANGTALFPGGPTSPYAHNIFAYTGFLNQIPGSGEPQTTAFGVELYMATRTQTGWRTKYVGVPGNKGIAQTSAPGNEYGGGTPFEYHCFFEEEEQFTCGQETPSALPSDSSLEHVLVWNRHQKGLLGGLRDGTNAPEVYDNEGHYVETLPTNDEEVEGAEKTMDEGGWLGSAAISPDYSDYAFSSIKAVFAPGGLNDPPGSVYDDNIETGEVAVVSKQENGEDIHSDPKTPLNEEYLRVAGISNDGSHILISSGAPTEKTGYRFTRNVHLYMAVNEGNGVWKHYDVTKNKNGKDVGVLFEPGGQGDMTSDGSKVFFITSEQMTADDTDTSRDLFEWNEERAKNGEEALVRVSRGNNGAGNTDECEPVLENKKQSYEGSYEVPWTAGLAGEGSTLDDCSVRLPFIWQGKGGAYGEESNLADTRMASETGEIYFYSPERLDGARGFPNKRNLYVWRDGKAQFVATLEPSHDGTYTPKAVERINVSPDGKHMAFITKTRLTGYDNTGHSEMYTYDPAERTIKCVSCRPDGKPPISDVKGSTNGLFMSFDGRTFFSTRDSLTPRDANENIDVYEFTDGRPQLITTGTSDDAGNEFQHPGLVGVSGNGVDVFFTTFQTLLSQDENGEQIKFYDARVNGGFPAEPLNPPCQAADECHGEVPAAPAPPEIGSSAQLGNGGNWHSAHKKHRKQKKHRKHKSKHKRRSRHG